MSLIEINSLKQKFSSILKNIFGPSLAIAITFHMKRTLNEEPTGVLLESPRTYYEGLQELFGEKGAQHIIFLIEDELLRKNVISSSRNLLMLFLENNKEKLDEIWRELIKSNAL